MGVSRETWEQARQGVRDSALVGLGIVPLGLAFGLLITQAGFAWWWAPVFSVVIYAGSMEFLAINMVLTGVGPVSSAVTALMVNFRHLFYGLTFPATSSPRPWAGSTPPMRLPTSPTPSPQPPSRAPGRACLASSSCARSSG